MASSGKHESRKTLNEYIRGLLVINHGFVEPYTKHAHAYVVIMSQRCVSLLIIYVYLPFPSWIIPNYYHLPLLLLNIECY